jgi:hypothetical protein
MTCTRPQAESQKNPLTRGRRPHMTHSEHGPLWEKPSWLQLYRPADIARSGKDAAQETFQTLEVSLACKIRF